MVFDCDGFEYYVCECYDLICVDYCWLFGMCGNMRLVMVCLCMLEGCCGFLVYGV